MQIVNYRAVVLSDSKRKIMCETVTLAHINSGLNITMLFGATLYSFVLSSHN